MEIPSESALMTAPRRLYFWVGAVAFASYLFTLNHWAGLDNLFALVEIHHWNWQPTLFPPVFYLCLLPLRLLPASWVPVALNLFSAILASLTLVVLARTVALLPQDRIEAQRLLVRHPQGLLNGPHAWLPPVFATLVLGLEVCFWEHATLGSGEMLDLFLLAVAIWCLMEYRLDKPRRAPLSTLPMSDAATPALPSEESEGPGAQSLNPGSLTVSFRGGKARIEGGRDERGQGHWLNLSALTTGLAIANTWAALAFLPVLVLALLRLRRPLIFRVNDIRRSVLLAALREDFRFWGRMLACGAVGISVSLIVPLARSLSADTTAGFWQTMRALLRSYLAGPIDLFARCWQYPQGRITMLPLAAATLVPALALCVRLPDFSLHKRPGVLTLESAVAYLFHAFLLLTSLVVLFDPPFSPQQVSQSLGLSLSLLGLYYLAALSVGYYSGFFLLVFRGTARYSRIVYGTLRWTAPKVIYGLCALAALGLLARNTPFIHALNGPHLSRFGRFMVEPLPAGEAIVFSSDLQRLTLLQAGLQGNKQAPHIAPVNLLDFGSVSYRAWLRTRYPWLAKARATSAPIDPFSPEAPIQLITTLAASNRVCCLENMLGPLLEHVCLHPRGLIFELQPFPADRLAPVMGGEDLDASSARWDLIKTEGQTIARLLQQGANPQAAGPDRFREWSRFKLPPHSTITTLAHWYSCALNVRGVCLQRARRWEEASQNFRLALELNQENLTARANLRCNQDLLAGRALDTRPGARELEDFGKYRNWLEMQLLCGPCDEPAYLCRLALTLEQLGLWRQAGQSLERVAELAPNDAKARLELANVYAHCRLPEPAFQCIEEVRTHPDRLAQINSPELTVTMLTAQAWYASSWYASSNRLKAESVLHSFIERHLTDPELLDQTRKVLLENQSYELAGWTADLRLQISPEALPAMMDKALCHMRLGQFSNSIPVLTHVLSLTNSPEPLLFRAEAYIGAANLDAAAADFQELLRTLPGSAMAYEGLAEVARRKGATNEAIGYYQQCLANAASGSDVARIVSARLRELQPQR